MNLIFIFNFFLLFKILIVLSIIFILNLIFNFLIFIFHFEFFCIIDFIFNFVSQRLIC